jgi:hypothetical protein
MIHHIGAGDVYVIAGQSNAAGFGKDIVYDPAEPGVHLLRNSGLWDLATHPFNDNTHTSHHANDETANPAHSPYLAFARRLKKVLGYPIGLIQASQGGSPLSLWDPLEDGTLYRNMLNSISVAGGGSPVGAVKGILWYQGCSDADGELAATYLERFTRMAARLRADLRDPDLPLLTVQLNRVINAQTPDEGWSLVREAQRRAARNSVSVPHTA